MRSKNVTLADIAKDLGISKNAVSLALRNKEGVSRELRERVMAKANEMHYQAVSKMQGCILALIPQRYTGAGSIFYHRLCFEMEAYAASLGYQLIISSVSESAEAQCQEPYMLSAARNQGIISIGNLSRDYCRMLQNLHLRYVMADQYYEDILVDSVTTANTSGAYLLTTHLIENGHRAIQFLGAVHRTSSLEDRWIGFRRALRDHDLPILSNSLLQDRECETETPERICRALDSMDELPSAFVCGNDSVAHNLILELEKRGLHCPQDVSVVGFDNVETYDVLSHDLTTYATPSTGIAHAAIDLLKEDSASPRRIQLLGRPIYRSSVRRMEE